MGIVMIKCPRTGEAVSTGLGMEHIKFEGSTFEDHQMGCRACGHLHIWSKKDAWLAEPIGKSWSRIAPFRY
jgi:hypothetical protein